MQPALIVSSNPLLPVPQPVPVPVGAILADLCPRTGSAVVCRLNGEWILRADWQRPAQPGDVIEFHELAGDGGEFRSVLQIGLMVAAMWVTAGGAAGLLGVGTLSAGSFGAAMAGMAVSLLGNALLNAVFPGESGTETNKSPAYNTSLAGNQARLDSPIPVAYGYNKHWPDFAAQPYVEYDANGDQYYHALLCIGHGNFDVKRVLLDDTPTSSFQDVKHELLEPGQTPTLVNANVTTATEVSGQDMLTGKIIGGFAACSPRRMAAAIGIDIVCPALGVASGKGNMSERTVAWRVEARQIDDFGLPTGKWALLGAESLTAATTNPVRRSYKYTLSSPYRAEVRVVRTDAQVDESSNYDDIQWAGLRAYLSDQAPLCATATYIEVRMRASEQLSGLSQRKFAVIAGRKLRTWSPAGGWSAEVETRNPCWALADKWTNTVYGDALPDARIDLLTLHSLAAVADARQDRFDYIFDTTTDSQSADQLIARVMRAAVFRRQGVRTLARDAQEALPAAAFTARNIGEGSWNLSMHMPTSEDAQGIRVEYLDNRSWDWRSIDCPLPGITANDDTRWQTVRLPGVTGETHAKREGLHMAAAMLYRRGNCEWETEMEGAMVAYNAAVSFAPTMFGWAASGDVVSWTAGSRIAQLTEPLTVTSGMSIVLIDHVGKPTAAIAVSQGVDAYHVVLATDPGFTPSTEAGNRERTRWYAGTASQMARTVRVRSITPAERKFADAPRFQLAGVVEDNRVHTADAAWLPTVGQVQDPVDEGGAPISGGGSGGGGGGGTLYLPQLSGLTIDSGAVTSGGTVGVAGLRMTNDGRLWSISAPFTTAVPAQPIAGQWLYQAPVTPEVADDFEVFVELLNREISVQVEVGTGSQSVWQMVPSVLRADSAPAGVWLPINQTLTWYADDGTTVNLRISIRTAADQQTQAVANMTLISQTWGGGA